MKNKYDSLIWKTVSNIILILFSMAALLPFILLIIASFTKEEWAVSHGYSFFPGEWAITSYKYILSQSTTFLHGYLNTIIVTAVGTSVGIMLTSLLAYALTNDRLPGVKILNFLCISTMLFSGGQVASYYVWSSVFQLRDTIWALILPNLLMNAFNIILVKNYYKTNIPVSLKEAAKVDGCSEFRIFWTIVMPLSIPITATIGLMTGLVYWNDWVNGLYYLTARNGAKYYTIQIILNRINESISWLANQATNTMSVSSSSFPATTARMGIAVIGMLPILILLPYMQKYFVKGITIGAVKE